MRRRIAVSFRLVAPLAVTALVLAGCSDDGAADAPVAATQSAAAAAPSSPEERAPASVEGHPLPDCSGQDAATCVYDGFDPMVDGFGFENWGAEGTVNASTLVALFGERAVCADVTAGGCVVYPAAAAWAQQINEAMAGGHCEGMAVLSRLIFDGYMSADTFEPGATTTYELLRDDPDVVAAIDMWWATQMLPPVQAAYNEFKSYQPSEIVNELAQGLQAGKGYTMGIYSEDGAHAITPIGVELEGDMVAVSVYDNNYPGTVQRVMIDLVNETWSYAAGATNPDAPTGGWEGGQGTIELTPMASRELPSVPPFEDETGQPPAATPVTLMVTSADPAVRTGIVLAIDGQEYDTTDPSVNLPEGVVARSTLGATLSGKGMIVSVNPSVIGGFSARAKVVGGAAATPVTLSYDRLGSPRVTLSAGVDPQGATGFDVDSAGGAIRTILPDGATARLQVDNGLNRLTFAVPEGVASYVGSGEGGQADIAFLDGNDELLDSYVLGSDNVSDRVVYGTGEFDPETGAFEVTEEFAEPAEFDAALAASLTDGFDEAFADDAAVEDDTVEDDTVEDDTVEEPAEESVDDDPVDEAEE